MKSSQSYIPTRTHIKFKSANQEHTYQVLKLSKNSVTDGNKIRQKLNMFRDKTNPIQKEEIKKEPFRPVGGKEIFKKMHELLSERKLTRKKTNRDITQSNISSSYTRLKKEPQDATQTKIIPQTIQQNQGFRKSFSEFPEELLKQHIIYDSYIQSSKLKKVSLTPKFSNKSQKQFRAAISSKGDRHLQWAANQRSQYHQKAAFLNEINFKKPRVQIYGDRYFEFTLRNRFQDDLRPPPYVYLLRNKKSASSRVITKLKQYRPDIKHKQMILARGCKLKTDKDMNIC